MKTLYYKLRYTYFQFNDITEFHLEISGLNNKKKK